MAAPVDEYHLRAGVYQVGILSFKDALTRAYQLILYRRVGFANGQANSTWGEYAGYSASIVGNKSIEWIKTVA